MNSIYFVRFRTALSYLPAFLALVLTCQRILSHELLIHSQYGLRNVIDTTSDPLLLPFPNALWLLAIPFMTFSRITEPVWVIGWFFLIALPLSILSGRLIRWVSTSWLRLGLAVLVYGAISFLFFVKIGRMVL